MPTDARIDQRYRKESCRTLAYRIRKRGGLPPATAYRNCRGGGWTTTPTIASALAALAELQARGNCTSPTTSKQDDIAFRHACPTPSSGEVCSPSETAARLVAKDAHDPQLQPNRTARNHEQRAIDEMARQDWTSGSRSSPTGSPNALAHAKIGGACRCADSEDADRSGCRLR